VCVTVVGRGDGACTSIHAQAASGTNCEKSDLLFSCKVNKLVGLYFQNFYDEETHLHSKVRISEIRELFYKQSKRLHLRETAKASHIL